MCSSYTIPDGACECHSLSCYSTSHSLHIEACHRACEFAVTVHALMPKASTAPFGEDGGVQVDLFVGIGRRVSALLSGTCKGSTSCLSEGAAYVALPLGSRPTWFLLFVNSLPSVSTVMPEPPLTSAVCCSFHARTSHIYEGESVNRSQVEVKQLQRMQ
jgi:hypothetical protein